MKNLIRTLFACILAFVSFTGVARSYSNVYDYEPENANRIYLIGDFNDWKIPTEETDNGAISGRYFQTESDFQPLKSAFFKVSIFLSAGTHRLALYDKDANVFLTFSHPVSNVDMRDAYSLSGSFLFADPRLEISPGVQDFETCAKRCAFEITVSRDYGAWVKFTKTLIGYPYLEIALDCPDFTLQWDTSETTLPDAKEDTSSYFNLEGLPVSNPDNGIYIEKKGNSSKKIIF